MLIQDDVVDVAGPAGVVRCALARPAEEGRFPLVLCFSDIFGNTDAHARLTRRLAGYGFVVASPEPWGRFLPTGTVFDFERDRQLALAAQDRADVAAADADRHAVLAALRALPFVEDGPRTVRVLGFCYGGHLAVRAACADCVCATAACYGTGMHNDKLGGAPADTLARVGEIAGELLLVWGRHDPHIPAAGRAKIHRALDDAGVRYEARFFSAEHAFMRDVGPRYDPVATDDAFAAIVALFRRGERRR